MSEDIPFIRARPQNVNKLSEFSDGDEETLMSEPSADNPNFDFLWEEYQKRLHAQKEWDELGIDIHPDYGFVAKTRLTSDKKKVFINIVSSPMLAPPAEEPVPSGEAGQTRIRIPMSCEGPFNDMDKGTHIR
jgi:hypothetical protein